MEFPRVLYFSRVEILRILLAVNSRVIIVLIGISMAEAKAVGVGKKKHLKKSKEGKGGMTKLAAIGAALVVVVAIAMTYNHSQIHKSCHCSQVLFVFLFVYFVVSPFLFISEMVELCVTKFSRWKSVKWLGVMDRVIHCERLQLKKWGNLVNTIEHDLFNSLN